MAGYAQMMQQMKKMQRNIDEKQKELDVTEFNATAASGAVKVTALGTKEITKIEIADELISIEEKDMLIDLIRLATNNVIADVEKTSEEELAKLTGGMNMPGLF